MGYTEDLQRVNAKIDRISGQLAQIEGAPKKSHRPSLYVSIIACLIALGAWIEPRISNHLSEDAKRDIAKEVSDQLKEPIKQIGTMSSDIAEMKGELKVLDPLIREMIEKKVSAVKNLSPDQLNANTPRANKRRPNRKARRYKARLSHHTRRRARLLKALHSQGAPAIDIGLGHCQPSPAKMAKWV